MCLGGVWGGVWGAADRKRRKKRSSFPLLSSHLGPLLRPRHKHARQGGLGGRLPLEDDGRLAEALAVWGMRRCVVELRALSLLSPTHKYTHTLTDARRARRA